MRTCSVVVVCAFVTLGCPPARATTNFNKSGSSYTANVAHRRDASGAIATRVAGTNLIGCTVGWNLTNAVDGLTTLASFNNVSDADSNDTGTAQIDLGRTFKINYVKWSHQDNSRRWDTQEISVSTDGAGWTVVVPRAAISGNGNATFTPADARYVRFQGWSPVGAGLQAVEIIEYEIYAATNSALIPQVEDGYAMEHAVGGTILNLSSNWSGNPIQMMDGNNMGSLLNATTPVPPAAQIDLKRLYRVGSICVGFYSGWSNGGKLETSPDGSTWTTRFSTNGNWPQGLISFPVDYLRYVQITGSSNIMGQHLYEVMIYAQPPRAGTVIVLM